MDWAEVFKQILKFFPRLEVLSPDEGGLFIRCGKLKRVIKNGMYFCFPYFDEITRFTRALTSVKATSQSITSKDKKDLLISWSGRYLIVDGEKAFLLTDDIDEQVIALISARIVDYVGKHDYENIKGHLLTNHIMHKEFLPTFIETWGISLEGFYLHDLGLHRIFRLVSNRDAPPNTGD